MLVVDIINVVTGLVVEDVNIDLDVDFAVTFSIGVITYVNGI